MAITNAFRSAVAAGNIIGVRIMMKDSLLVDPTFAEYGDMEQYTRTMSGLYDDHDGRELNGDSSAWNDDYMNTLMVQVVGNFSRERIDHLKKVVRHLRPVVARTYSTNAGNVKVNIRGSASGGSNVRVSGGGSSTSNRASYGRPSYSPRPSNRQRTWGDSRNSQLRTARIATGAVAGGVVVGAVTAIAGGSFVAGAAVGAVVAGTVIWVATSNRR